MIFSFLNKPFPWTETNAGKWKTIFFTSLFVSAFLFVFRPFGLHRFMTLDALRICGGYGLVTFAIVSLNLFLLVPLLPRVFDEKRWTVGKEITFLMWVIFTIGLGNATYSLWIFADEFSWEYMVSFQFYTLLVALLPVSINVISIQLILTRKNLKDALELSGHMHHKKRLDGVPDAVVSLHSENKKESIEVPARDLLYITSADNYIEVHYLEGGQERKKLLRGTLKNTREDLRKYTAFYRCHRAFIVNLDRVESVTGNAQGYRLVMNGTGDTIPVSRSLNKEITLRLSK